MTWELEGICRAKIFLIPKILHGIDMIGASVLLASSERPDTDPSLYGVTFSNVVLLSTSQAMTNPSPTHSRIKSAGRLFACPVEQKAGSVGTGG